MVFLTKSTFLNLIFIVLTITACFFPLADSHSWLLEPEAYNIAHNPDGCLGYECQACPDILGKHAKRKMNNTADEPEVTWQRGEKVTIRWAKNNHIGGFVRLSIVPLDKTMDSYAHTRLAFYHGCWEQGHYQCFGDMDCALDKNKVGLSRQITVPSYLPDGVYILGYLWYGALVHTGNKPGFPDYPSCSYVRIQGGAPLSSEPYQPFFDAGQVNGNRFQRRDGKCRTYVDRPYVCTDVMQKDTPGRCEFLKPYRGIPFAFSDGKQPPVIHSSYLHPGSTFETFEVPSPSPIFSAVPTQPTVQSQTPFASPIMPAEASAPASTPALPTPSPSPPIPQAVCTDNVCCPASCGSCGSRGCKKRPGGKRNCCVTPIIRSKRYCNNYSPPCIRRDSGNPICKEGVCCPKSCGGCGGHGCKFRPGGPDNCCRRKIRKIGRRCGEYPPPCVQ